ncbi:MAG: hypothetical protein B7Z72_11200, partial [Gemmatimonadetes bacterium 21-71-4]
MGRSDGERPTVADTLTDLPAMGGWAVSSPAWRAPGGPELVGPARAVRAPARFEAERFPSGPAGAAMSAPWVRAAACAA